jgi:hypothetical protein
MIMKRVAIAKPPVPPSASPRFQPKYIPDITYPTPKPQRRNGLSVRLSAGDDNSVIFLEN